MNIDVFIPVRLGSERLPKKSLKVVNGKPLICHLVERLSQANRIRKIIVCTTITKSDDELVDYLKENKILFFRGSEHDILNRYLQAAKSFATDFIINVEGDDIYTDPECVDLISNELQKLSLDYVDIDKMPLGLSPSGIKVSALEKICSIKQSNNTETGYKRFFTESGLFRIKHLILNKNLNFPKNVRLSLDYVEDLKLAEKIFDYLGNNFNKKDLSNLFQEKPDLLDVTDGLDERYKLHFQKYNVDISTKDI